MTDDRPNLDDLRIHHRPGERSVSGLWWGMALLLLFLAGGAAFWWVKRPSALLVRTVVARESQAPAGASERIVLNASGYVTARREATVSSKITGKVVEVLIEEGMKVVAGQVLARLDDTNVKASLALTEAQLGAAKASLEETRVRIREAEINLQRVTGLAQSQISPKAELDRAEAEVNSLKARLQQQHAQVTVAEREVASWNQNLEDTIIRSPFSGIVTSKNAQPGEMISPISAGGGFTRTGICTIVDMASLEVEIDVNESYINRVQPNQPVIATLDAYPERKLPCRVIAIIPSADRQKSTVRVRVGFDSLDPRILPEMSIKVAFRQMNEGGAQRSMVSVPRSAVQKSEGKDVVMVVQEGRAERRAVTVAGTGPAEVAIASGLTAGEKVVEGWPQGLKDGMAVKEIVQ